jgi:DNA-directed RNA polymerase specialized sigma24 family protein
MSERTIEKVVKRFEKDENAAKKMAAADIKQLRSYALKCFQNICHDQLTAWGGRGGAIQDRVELNREGTWADTVLAEYNDIIGFPGGPEPDDLERVDEFLVERGLSNPEISLLKQHLDKMSYVQMAKEYGGSEDKYRKIVARAKQKAGLDVQP